MKRTLPYLAILVAGCGSSAVLTSGDGASSADASASDAAPPVSATSDTSQLDGGDSRAPGNAEADDATKPLPQAGQPVFLPEPGAYFAIVPVVIATGTPDAAIFYTTDGTTPTSKSNRFVPGSTVDIAQSTTLRAIATRAGFEGSAVTDASYSVYGPWAADGVTFSPNGGNEVAPLEVTLATTLAKATICYTVDGSTPSCAIDVCIPPSMTFGGPITITAPLTVLKALSCKQGRSNSGVSTAAYNLAVGAANATPGYAPAPVVFPPPGQAVVLNSALQGAAIHYTIDGSAPSCASTRYVSNGGATPVIDHDLTLKTIACKPGYADSAETDFEYVIR